MQPFDSGSFFTLEGVSLLREFKCSGPSNIQINLKDRGKMCIKIFHKKGRPTRNTGAEIDLLVFGIQTFDSKYY